MDIKYATTEDIAAITAVEAECFPPAEAATEKEFVERIRYYGNHFWLMYEAEKLIAFVDGFVTDEPDLTDEMYENAVMHGYCRESLRYHPIHLYLQALDLLSVVALRLRRPHLLLVQMMMRSHSP